MRRCVPFTSAYITPASATPTVITVPMIHAVSGFMPSSYRSVRVPAPGDAGPTRPLVRREDRILRLAHNQAVHRGSLLGAQHSLQLHPDLRIHLEDEPDPTGLGR